MKMAGDIRVRTNRRYRTLYNDLRNFAAKDMHEIFFICAVFGYREGKREPLGREGDDRFWSSTITPEEYACYYAMLIEASDMDFSRLLNDKSVIMAIEEYANAGMKILLDNLLDSFVIERGGDIRLEGGCSKELPKILLGYLYDNVKN